jgi:hypothetical protein
MPLPGLETVKNPQARTEIQVCFGASPYDASTAIARAETLTFTSMDVGEDGEPALRIWSAGDGSFRRLCYYDGVQFWIDRRGENVWAQWPESSSFEDAASYLVGPVLGLLLRIRGINCLHASAVRVGNGAVAFGGVEGAGKSTTAAAFARRGCSVLSDDIVALGEQGGRICVIPAYPYLSLWQDSVEMLYGPDKKLPRFSDNWEKRLLSLAGNSLRFEEQAMPLRAIYMLGGRSSAPGAPFLEEITPREAMLELVANSYASSLLETEMRAREFELLGRLVTRVTVLRIRPHSDPTRIDRLVDLILESNSSNSI